MDMYGEEFVEKELRDDFVQKLCTVWETKKQKFKPMSIKELDELCGISKK
jgi:NAD dependent epimerase/dehydratase family enzyme